MRTGPRFLIWIFFIYSSETVAKYRRAIQGVSQSPNPRDETMFCDVGAGTDARNIITKAQTGGQCIKMEMNDRIK